MDPTKVVAKAPSVYQHPTVIINTAPTHFVQTEIQKSYQRKPRGLAVSTQYF